MLIGFPTFFPTNAAAGGLKSALKMVGSNGIIDFQPNSSTTSTLKLSLEFYRKKPVIRNRCEEKTKVILIRDFQ